MAPSLLAYHSLGSCFSQQVVLVVAFGHREYIILPTHQDLLKVLFLGIEDWRELRAKPTRFLAFP